MPLGQVPGSIADIQWLPDGNHLAVLAADVDRESENTVKAFDASAAHGLDPEIRQPGQSWRRLYFVAVDTGATTEVGPPGLTVWEFTLDADQIAMVVSEDPLEGGWYDAWIGILDADTRQIVRVNTPLLQVEHLQLSPNSEMLAWVENICSDRSVVSGPLVVLELASGKIRKVAEDAEVASLAWIDDTTLRVCGPRGLGAYCGVVDIDQGVMQETFSGPVRLGPPFHPSVASDAAGRLFAVYETIGAPPEVAVLEPELGSPAWRGVTALNSHLIDLPAPEMRETTWISDDGLEIEGLLIRPAGADAGLPMIVTVHGGPTGRWDWGFSPGYWAAGHLFAEAGYAVLLPNPRGSSGRGPAFAAANLGDLGGRDFQDILAGIDACVERGIADPDRIGIWGISYGGFMASWAVGNSDRFAASVPVSCHTNWISFQHSASIPAYGPKFLDADLYDSTAVFWERSPVSHARDATAPTLFLHGALDRCCPVGQAEEMYRALSDAGCETELVIYPREGHGGPWFWDERAHALDGWERLRDWMDRHVRERKASKERTA